MRPARQATRTVGVAFRVGRMQRRRGERDIARLIAYVPRKLTVCNACRNVTRPTI